jgi:dihydroflavonol-4-reductase
VADFYIQSKCAQMKVIDEYLAEQAGKDYKLKIFTIHPSLIMGPVLMDVPGSTVAMMKKLLEGGMPMAAKLMLSWIDVRDVSEAHIKCLVDPNLESNSFIISED